MSRRLGDGDLRPYLPLEVCKILRAVCEFNQAPMVLDLDGVDRVASIYFTRAGELRSAEAEAASAAGGFSAPEPTPTNQSNESNPSTVPIDEPIDEPAVAPAGPGFSSF